MEIRSTARMRLKDLLSDIGEYGQTLSWYAGRKTRFLAGHFEGAKGLVVDVLKARRGTYQKPFLHFGMFLLTILAVFSAQFLLETYPSSMSVQAVSASDSPSAVLNDQADITNIDTVTTESEKARRDVVSYTVQGGDTLSSIAQKFSDEKLGVIVDADSIAYLNDFNSEQVLRPGDVIKIPPVAGVIVTVKSGDTIESLAKKYGLLSSQAVVDWPYNSFANDEKFTLAAGQTLVIPGGRAPEVVAVAPTQAYHTPSSTPFSAGSGQFAWPVQGIITQYFSYYHPAIDIAGSTGDPVGAADSGRVVTAGWNAGGYGNYVIIDHGNGFRTLYGHLSKIYVSEGDNVGRGQTIGLRGSTGRSTGPHTHFEIYRNGERVNPLGYLK